MRKWNKKTKITVFSYIFNFSWRYLPLYAGKSAVESIIHI